MSTRRQLISKSAGAPAIQLGMKTDMKIFFALVFVVLAGVSANAQETPTVEVTATYTYVRINSTGVRSLTDPRSGQVIVFTIPAFSANGGTGSVAYNFTDHIGAVAELGAFHNGNISDLHIDNTWFTFLFGPRFSLVPRSHSVVPSLHVLLGGVRTAASVFLPPLNTTPPAGGVRLSTSWVGFSMGLGGSLDIKLNKTIGLRPIQLDYLFTRIGSTALGSFNDFNQNNLRYQAGVDFRF